MNFDQAKAAFELSSEMLYGINSSEGKSEVFLKLDGVEGESGDSAHGKEIEVSDFTFVEWQQGSAGKGGGSGATRPSFDSINFICSVSKATPKLFLGCVKGTRFATAVFSFRKSGGGQQDFMKVTLSDAVLKTYCQRLEELPDGSKGIQDGIKIDYAKIEIEYRPQNPNGSLGSPLSFSFDQRGK